MTTSLKDCHYSTAIVSVIHNTDPIAALVHGYVRFLCDLKGNGDCFASQETMADFLGISRYTVIRKLKILCDKGYLVDQTPGRRNKPHVYSETGLAGEQEIARIAALEDKADDLVITTYGDE